MENINTMYKENKRKSEKDLERYEYIVNYFKENVTRTSENIDYITDVYSGTNKNSKDAQTKELRGKYNELSFALAKIIHSDTESKYNLLKKGYKK